MQDLIVKNAMIHDGTGGAPYIGNVAVKEGLIANIGEDNANAREVIDADGLALMPGIIDNHTHYDAQITWDPLASPSVRSGPRCIQWRGCRVFRLAGLIRPAEAAPLWCHPG